MHHCLFDDRVLIFPVRTRPLRILPYMGTGKIAPGHKIGTEINTRESVNRHCLSINGSVGQTHLVHYKGHVKGKQFRHCDCILLFKSKMAHVTWME